MLEVYHSFQELRRAEIEGLDYQIRFRERDSGIAVLAPHGGGIEPGTTEIADRVADKTHSFYSFEGWKRKGNLDLHVTSRRFDEPAGVRIAEQAETVLTIHGCTGADGVVYIGGRDKDLVEKIWEALEQGLFRVMEHPRFPGTSPLNICNRSRTKKGVQLELTRALRCSMFQNLSRPERKKTTGVFDAFVGTLKKALSPP